MDAYDYRDYDVAVSDYAQTLDDADNPGTAAAAASSDSSNGDVANTVDPFNAHEHYITSEPSDPHYFRPCSFRYLTQRSGVNAAAFNTAAGDDDDDEDPLRSRLSKRQRRPTATANNSSYGYDYSRLYADCSEYFDRTTYPRRCVLASTVPRTMTYWLFPNAQLAVEHIVLHSGDRFWFRYIEDDDALPCFAYFDIERDRASQQHYSTTQFWHDARRTVAYFTCFVDALYMVRSGELYHRNNVEWRFYDSSRADKLSVHAHSTLLFANVRELRKVVTRFVEFLSLLRAQNDERVASLFVLKKRQWRCIVDASVYTARPFRLPYQRKDVTTPADCYLLPVLLPATIGSNIDARMDHLRFAFIHPLDMYAADANEYRSPLPLLADLVVARERVERLLRAFVQSPSSAAPTLLTSSNSSSTIADHAAAGGGHARYYNMLLEASRLVHQVCVQLWGSSGDNDTSVLRTPVALQRLDNTRTRDDFEQLFCARITQRSELVHRRTRWLQALAHLTQHDAIACEQRQYTRMSMWGERATLLQRAWHASLGRGREKADALTAPIYQRVQTLARRAYNTLLCVEDFRGSSSSSGDDEDAVANDNDHEDAHGDFYSEYAFCALGARMHVYCALFGLAPSTRASQSTSAYTDFLRYGMSARRALFALRQRLANACPDDDGADDEACVLSLRRKSIRADLKFFRTYSEQLFFLPETVASLEALSICTSDPLQAHALPAFSVHEPMPREFYRLW